MSTVVEIISREGCHLCEIARETVLAVQRTHRFELRETKLFEGHPLNDQFSMRVPVIVINGKFAFQFKVSEADLAAKLKGLER
jgi:glutaredoxin